MDKPKDNMHAFLSVTVKVGSNFPIIAFIIKCSHTHHSMNVAIFSLFLTGRKYT